MSESIEKERKRLLKNLKFLANRFRRAGMLYDPYFETLSIEDLRWIEDSSRKYYAGENEPNEAYRKEANARRYRACDADVMANHAVVSLEDCGEDELGYDDLDPEKILLLKESMRLRIAEEGEED